MIKLKIQKADALNSNYPHMLVNNIFSKGVKSIMIVKKNDTPS